MGYRNYLGSLPKKEYNKIKSMSLKEVYEFKNEEWSDDPDDQPGHVGVYDIAYNQHYELGKYVDQFDKKFFKPVFKNKETQKYYLEDHDFYVVEKEFIEELIKHYTKKIKAYYSDMLKPFFDEDRQPKSEFIKNGDASLSDSDRHGIYKILDHIRDMGIEWGVNAWFEDTLPYNLTDPDKDFITSWKYEYSIFNLVILYHTFDWKKNVMIYYGY